MIKGSDDANTKDHVLIIDNSEFPEGGAMPQDDIILEFSYFNEYKMLYNLRDTSVIMGIIGVFLSFMTGAFFYLGCKIRRDVRSKFLSDNQDEDSEEEDEITDYNYNDNNLKQRLILNNDSNNN